MGGHQPGSQSPTGLASQPMTGSPTCPRGWTTHRSLPSHARTAPQGPGCTTSLTLCPTHARDPHFIDREAEAENGVCSLATQQRHSVRTKPAARRPPTQGQLHWKGGGGARGGGTFGTRGLWEQGHAPQGPTGRVVTLRRAWAGARGAPLPQLCKPLPESPRPLGRSGN